jgi:hypothetical protein
VKTLRFALFWWLALGGWWVVLVGTNAGLELVAAACAATLGTALALALRRRRLLRYRFEPIWVAKTLKEPWKIVYELGVVTWALALHLAGVRRVAGAYRTLAFPAGGSDAASAGRRALAVAADGISPNTLPVDVDCERDLALRHELDARRASNTLP